MRVVTRYPGRLPAPAMGRALAHFDVPPTLYAASATSPSSSTPCCLSFRFPESLRIST